MSFTIDTYIHLLPDDLVPATFFDSLTTTGNSDRSEGEPIAVVAVREGGVSGDSSLGRATS